MVLGLVTYYQNGTMDDTMDDDNGSATTLFVLTAAYLLLTSWALFSPPNVSWGPSQQGIALAQVAATILSTSALVPQLKQNYDRQSSGDYSPITASLASVGCGIRLFTTVELASGDPLLLLNYGVALLLNVSVLAQVVYYGTQYEGRSLVSLFLADVKSADEGMK